MEEKFKICLLLVSQIVSAGSMLTINFEADVVEFTRFFAIL